jgi:CRP-like cAMP-binding protein
MPAQLLAYDDRRASDPDPIEGGGRLSFLGIARGYCRDQRIFAEGDSTDMVYKVVSGAVRIVRLLADGRRQVTGFHFPGDVFGVDLRSARCEAAEAVGEAVVNAARRSSLTAAPGEALWRHAMGELQRSQDHVLTLGRRSAAERVASFLLDLAERLDGGDALALPMSRQDIADYLGLTIETVSRTLTQLQANGLVRVTGCRQVRLLRPAALAGLCE